MSVVVSRKRSLLEEEEEEDHIVTSSSSSSAGGIKRIRRYSTSSPTLLLHRLRSLFPSIDILVLENVLDNCDNDLDAAIKKLHELSIGYGAVNSSSAAAEESNANIEKVVADEEADFSLKQITEMGGAEWVELFVQEMMSATSVDDAKSRATKVLQSLEQSISTRAVTEAATKYQDNLMQKEQIEQLLRGNSILKRAVNIQHERQKENNYKNQEVQHLKQLVSQYQEKMRTLEVSNYTLKMHLRQVAFQTK